jgi:hypothetical protein
MWRLRSTRNRREVRFGRPSLWPGRASGGMAAPLHPHADAARPAGLHPAPRHGRLPGDRWQRAYLTTALWGRVRQTRCRAPRHGRVGHNILCFCPLQASCRRTTSCGGATARPGQSLPRPFRPQCGHAGGPPGRPARHGHRTAAVFCPVYPRGVAPERQGARFRGSG